VYFRLFACGYASAYKLNAIVCVYFCIRDGPDPGGAETRGLEQQLEKEMK
jgi:hypothetical protein